jgi:hypothetical protein
VFGGGPEVRRRSVFDGHSRRDEAIDRSRDPDVPGVPWRVLM